MSQFSGGGGAPPTPWYDRGLFWGYVGLCGLFIALGFGAAMSGYRVSAHIFFFLAWPWGVLVAWLALNGVTPNKRWRVIGRTIACILFGLMIGLTDRAMTRPSNPVAAVSAELTPQHNPAQPAPSDSSAPSFSGGSPISVNPAKLVFKDQPIGSISDPQTVAVVNRGSSRRVISSLKMTGDFSQTNDCGPELMVGDSCNIAVTFAPTKIGLVYGSLEISTSDPLGVTYTNPATVTFSGSAIKIKAVLKPGVKTDVTHASQNLSSGNLEPGKQNDRTTVGGVTFAPGSIPAGSVFSIGQQGGITAGTVKQVWTSAATNADSQILCDLSGCRRRTGLQVSYNVYHKQPAASTLLRLVL